MKTRNFYWSLEKGDLLSVLLILPTFLIIFFIMILPLSYGFLLSFFDVGFGLSNPTENFIGLDNYRRFLNDSIAQRAILNTLIFSFGAIAGTFFFGTVNAVLLHKLSRRFSAVLRPLLIMPLLISPLIVGLIWRYIYDPQGILYWFLGLFGLGIQHFPGVTASSTALLSTIIAHWWQVTPFIIIVLTAGLLSIPEEYYEAAYVDGAGAFSSFFRITLPLLKNTYMVILLLSGVDTFRVFDIIFSLTGGGPNNSSVSISIYAHSQAFNQANMSYAMALSTIAMFITFVVFGIPFIRHNIKKSKS
ncbi:MAG: sugar ABC transporter permease [Defluviitaleaceae bacterium]|nr:sugar ABC transporter permease [Defluviitaleaceae bacterium]MCL2239135.1 sugar ABC transporter permease [Defluviitaleaceae bacterium]